MMFNLLAIIGGTAIGNAMYLRFFPQYVHDAAQPQPKQGDHGSAQPHLQQGYSYAVAGPYDDGIPPSARDHAERMGANDGQTLTPLTN